MLTATECRKVWMENYERNKEAIDREINEKIERNRKGNATIRVLDKEGKPAAGVKLRVRQKNHDFKYGANLFMLDEFPTEELNQRYRDTFHQYFNLATVPFYWSGLEPEEGKPRYAKDSAKVYRRPAPDLCVEYCEEKGIWPKLHCLVYTQFSPEWLKQKSWAEQEQLYLKRFREISERYSGKMFEFEVINEWIDRSELYGRPDIIEWSFEKAREAFPNEVLVLNEDAKLEHTAQLGDETPYVKLIQKLLSEGTSIDKLGIQHHIFSGVTCHSQEEYEQEVKTGSSPIPSNPNMGSRFSADYETITKGLEHYVQFGKPFEITEVTIPTFGEGEDFEDLQADLLRLVYASFFASEIVDSVVYWNLPDSYAHANGNWNENNCRGGLFHKDMTPKKSALMLKHLFTELWHTDVEVVTDENGLASLRGFYGDYVVEAGALRCDASIHRNADNAHSLTLDN